MYKKGDRPAHRIRVLVSGALPPPMGGVGVYYQTLLDSSLSERVDLCFVQTSSQKRELSSTGRATLSNLIFAIMDCWRYTRAVLVNRPQIAHIYTTFGLSFVKHTFCVCIARLFGSQVLLHPHCSLSMLYTEQPRWWQWFFRWVVRRSNGIVALSKEWLQLRSIIPGCQVSYLPNAINMTQYGGVAEKRLIDANPKRPSKILYLGYLGKAKGSFDLLDAAAELRSRGIAMNFDLVGDELTPGEMELLKERIKASRLEGYVRLHSPAYGTAKIDFLQNADIFIYPSHYEGMPMAVLEAMACALPIVATRVGGLPDLIQDGINGILVEAGKPEQLAAGLCRLGGDYELLTSMRKANYQLVSEHYGIEQHVTQLVDIYKTTFSSSLAV